MRETREQQTPSGLFDGGGEMGALMRSLDWSSTPLGPAEHWSLSLRHMVRLLLANRFPLLLWWGPDACSLYNDAYRPILGEKHPRSMGQPGRDCWAEIWDIIGPLMRTPYEGGPATWDEDIALEINRHGFTEETHFTFAYSPVPDDSVERGIGGVLATVHETTQQVLQERRIAVLHHLSARTADAGSANQACEKAAEALGEHPKDLPFALFYLLDTGDDHARLVATAGVARGQPTTPSEIPVTGEQHGRTWPLAEVEQSRQPALVNDLAGRFTSVPLGPWSDPSCAALVLPLPSPSHQRLAGMVVLGLSPRLALDDSYRSFCELIGTQVANAIGNARAREEERERAEALVELDRAKTAFFSNVSHEFRTPLTLLLGPTQALLEGWSGPLSPAQRDEAAMIHRNALRLLRLVNALLDFSRIEAGRADAAYEPVALPEVTADLASAFRSTIERAGLRFIVDCPPLPPEVEIYLDRDMWEKIVLNLLSNAFKFTLAGEIEVQTSWAGDHVELCVRDTGAGITEGELPHVFERFHRIRGTSARTHEGSGIGLALVQELVRLHAGSIQVNSSPGAGSSFIVSIPAGRAHLPAERVSASHQLASTATGPAPFVQEAERWQLSGSGDSVAGEGQEFTSVAPGTSVSDALGAENARILLADDNADMRDYLTRLLSPRWRIHAVGDGPAALQAALEDPPDLVLSDIMMPGLDGFGLLRALRADPRTSRVPILLLSARAGEEARLEGLKAGADDYLAKPFAAGELVARVGAHLELARLRAAASQLEQEGRAERDAVSHRLHELFMTAPCIVAIRRGPDHHYELANPEYVRLAGDRDFIGRSIREAMPEIESQGYIDLLDRVYRTGEPFAGREMQVKLNRQGDGVLEEAFVNVVHQPAFDSDGNVDGVMTVAYDVTEQVLARRQIEMLAQERADLLEREQTARAEAEGANQAKDQFLSVLSHELRTPLTTIIGFSELLRRSEVSPERLRLALDTIERSARAQARLVEDLLDVSRILANKLSVDLGLVQFVPTVEAAIAAVQPMLTDRNLELIVALDPSVHEVWGDAGRLQQVVWNLLTNAAKFTQEGGRITVQLVQDNGWASLSVSDTGDGILPEFLPHLFERFRQADISAARQGGGLGLGLAISSYLIERHRGTLNAESPGLGQGSTFTVRLPLAHRNQTDRSRPRPQAGSAGLRPLAGLRALLVEDDADINTLLRLMLEEAGATVTTARSSPEGISRLVAAAPDVILADIGLPGEDGYTFISKVRRHPIGAGIPAVAVTAYASEDHRARALQSGFQQHLAKPVNREVLISTLNALARPDSD